MKRFFQSVMVALGVCVGCSKQPALAPGDFTKEFAEAVRKSGPSLKVEIVADLQLKIINTNGQSAASFLDNAYKEYARDPKGKERVFRQYIASGVGAVTEEKTAVTREQIVPIVKDRGWLKEMREGTRAAGYKDMPENVYDDLNSDLVVIYAADTPDSIRYLQASDLGKLNLEKKDLRAIACANLEKLLPPAQYRGGNGVYMITAGGNYEASLLVMESVWDREKMDVKGEFVFAIPTRDLLLVTGSEDSDGQKKLREIIKKAGANASYRLTDQLFIYKQGKVTRFEK